MPRLNLKCLNKIQLAPHVFNVAFLCDQEFEFKAGQFMNLEVAPKIMRTYSIVNVVALSNDPKSQNSGAKYLIEFLINTKNGGEGSKFIDSLKSGDELNGIGPAGRFGLNPGDKPKVFVATGTGLAPFVPMIKHCLDAENSTPICLFFGVPTLEYDFCHHYFEDYLNSNYPNFNIYICCDGIDAPKQAFKNYFAGRVTQALPEIVTDYIDSDFYVCGIPVMVSDMEALLRSKGANENIFVEKYVSNHVPNSVNS